MGISTSGTLGNWWDVVMAGDSSLSWEMFTGSWGWGVGVASQSLIGSICQFVAHFRLPAESH